MVINKNANVAVISARCGAISQEKDADKTKCEAWAEVPLPAGACEGQP